MAPKAMTCQESSGNLLARFRQELSSADSLEIEAHLENCGACRAEEAGIAGLAELISSLPEVDPSAGSWSRMLMMIEESETVTPVRGNRGRLIALSAVLAAALAAGLLLILLPASPHTLTAGPGEITLNGAPVKPGSPIEFEDGAVIEAGRMALATLTLTRSISMVMEAGTRVRALPGGHLRLLSGRIFVEVDGSGDPIRFYAVGDTAVEVTGTAFDLIRNARDPAATVTVAEGTVRVFTGRTPVAVRKGQSFTFGPGQSSFAPSAVDPKRTADWCSTPTILLSRDGDLLRLTIRNDTVRPLAVKPFDPHLAAYSLLVEGQEIRLPVKIQERMVRSPVPADQEIRTLDPGAGYDLLLDPKSLGLQGGTYRIRAVYKPYPPLPAEVWHGPPLTTEALTLTVE